jgi:hypothetical protein
MVSFRLIALTIMAAGLSVASDPGSSIGMPLPTKAVFHEAISPVPQGSYGISSSLIAFTREQVSNSDGSVVQVTKVSFQIFSNRLTVTLESGIVVDYPKSSVVPARFVVLSPEIIMVLSKQCSLVSQNELTCEADAMDGTKPSTRDSVNDVLAWFVNTLQASRAAFRYAATALTNDSPSPKSSVSTRFVSPEITRILSKQCPLIDQSEPTCQTVAMDATKSSSVNNVLAWFASTLQAPRATFRFAITALTPKPSVPARFVSPEINNILAKQCPLIVTTCEVDAMDTTPLTVLQTLLVVYRYAITGLTLGSIAYVASGFTMLASKVYLVAILLALAHCVIDDVPTTTTAMLIFGISIFAATLYFCAVTVKCWFKSPIKTKKSRVAISTIAELCDDVFGYVRNVLFAVYFIMFGSWQVMFGWVGDDPLKLLTQVVGTIVVAFIAKKETEAIWYYFWLVWIHACVSTVQFLIVGPCCIASDFVKNAFKKTLSTVFWALRTTVTFVPHSLRSLQVLKLASWQAPSGLSLNGGGS